MEEFIRNDIWGEIQNGKFAPNEWTIVFDVQNIIRKNSIVIPEDLYKKSLELLESFSSDVNKVVDYMRAIQMKKQTKEISSSEYKINLESKINDVYKNYRENIDKLRTEFRQISEKIYFNKQ